MREPAHVRHIQGESGAQIALHRKIERVGIWSLQRSIQAAAKIGGAERLHARYDFWEAGGRRSGLQKAWRNDVDARQAGQTAEGSYRVGEICGQTEGMPAELIHNALPEPIVHHSEAAADGGLIAATEELAKETFGSVGRPGKGHAGPKITVSPVPVSSFPVGFAAPVDLQWGIRSGR